MAIVRWRPYSEMSSLQNEMNRLLETFYGKREVDEGEASYPTWGPRVDIHETEEMYLFEVEVPGTSKEDIKLMVKEETLTIEGEKRYEHEEHDHCNCHRQERVFGKFRRSFTMPSAVDSEKIKASYKDGILRIELPKQEAVKPKEISISVK